MKFSNTNLRIFFTDIPQLKKKKIFLIGHFFLTFDYWGKAQQILHKIYIIQLIEQLILRMPNFNFPRFKVLQSVLIFFNVELYWHFWAYCDVNLKLCKNTQKVNKQKIPCKNLGFVLVV